MLNAEGELLRAENKERRAALAPRGGAADEVQGDARAVDAHAERAAATAARVPTEARVTTAVLPYPRLCPRVNPSRCS